jgi:hypothetical protein
MSKSSAKQDPLEPGRKMLEGMMTEAQRASSEVCFEDKLKLLDRWIKYQELVRRQKQGGMGAGFDDFNEEPEPTEL